MNKLEEITNELKKLQADVLVTDDQLKTVIDKVVLLDYQISDAHAFGKNYNDFGEQVESILGL